MADDAAPIPPSPAKVEGKAKRLTRQSIQLMKLSNRMKRTSLLPTSPGKKGGSLKGAMAEAIKEIEAAAEGPQEKTAEELEEEAEMLAMLKDSYREVTGRSMPEGMDAEAAMAELRVLQAAAWAALCKDEEPEEEAPAADGAAPPMSPLDKFRRGGKKARLSLRMGGVILRADPTNGANALKEEEWDETMLEMLKDSYREMTGHGIPTEMTPGQAYAELRKMQVAAWQDEGLAELVEETEEETRAFAESVDNLASKEQDHRSSCREFDADELDHDEPEDSTAALAAAAAAAAADGGPTPPPPPPGADLEGLGDSRLSRVGGIGTGVDEDWKPEKPALAGARFATGKDVFRAHATFQTAATKVFEGWLTKKGPGLFKGDKLRFFVLFASGEMHYFKAADMAEHKGMLTLEGLSAESVVNQGKLADGQWGVSIKTKARLWQLRSSSEGQAKAWKKNCDAIIGDLSSK